MAAACGPAVVPSPKSNVYDTTEPSASPEPDASSVTVSGERPASGAPASAAVGRWLAITVVEALLPRPASSTTVTVAVHVPAAYACAIVAPGCGPALVPSPKSKR